MHISRKLVKPQLVLQQLGFAVGISLALVAAEGLELEAEGLEVVAEGLEVEAEGLEAEAEGLEVVAEDLEVVAEGLEAEAEGLEVVAACRRPASPLRDIITCSGSCVCSIRYHEHIVQAAQGAMQAGGHRDVHSQPSTMSQHRRRRVELKSAKDRLGAS